MSDSTPGLIVFVGCATLDNKRPIPQKPLSFVYDATFTCSDPPTAGEEGVGSFRHYVGSRSPDEKANGIYDIIAKVVAFRPDRNEDSPEYTEDAIHVLGHITRMKSLPMETEDDIAATQEPMTVLGSGIVSFLLPETLSFIIHACQFTDGGEASDDLAIRCRLDLNPKWDNPHKRLPKLHSTVGFTGILQQFEKHTFPDAKKPTTCAVVTLDDITYIKREGTNTKSVTKKTPANDKAKTRVQKLKQAKTTTQALPSPSTSHKTLGKRKTDDSEDEVDDSILPTDDV
ncbi:hypothetical protein BJY52DRAFT_1194108 [Lactarius psammicola]|nr:hypothetical protein BJY52DRAFT_1194108 [Lactarius psammicola]